MAEFIGKPKRRAEDVAGKAKEKVAEVTGNDDLKAEGTADQGGGNAKQVGDNISDTASSVKGNLTNWLQTDVRWQVGRSTPTITPPWPHATSIEPLGPDLLIYSGSPTMPPRYTQRLSNRSNRLRSCRVPGLPPLIR